VELEAARGRAGCPRCSRREGGRGVGEEVVADGRLVGGRPGGGQRKEAGRPATGVGRREDAGAGGKPCPDQRREAPRGGVGGACPDPIWGARVLIRSGGWGFRSRPAYIPRSS
jgi:hypothetical protein